MSGARWMKCQARSGASRLRFIVTTVFPESPSMSRTASARIDASASASPRPKARITAAPFGLIWMPAPTSSIRGAFSATRTW